MSCFFCPGDLLRSFKFCPAQKALPVPVRMITRLSGSFSVFNRASLSSESICVVKLFKLSG